MFKTVLSLPELGLIAGTRGLLGAGVALLLADKLTEEKRKTVGLTLAVVGVLTTIPLAFEVIGNKRDAAPEKCSSPGGT